MAKVMLELASRTEPGWSAYILEHFDPFLVDHANAERKASALALSFVARYADRVEIIPALIELAREELEHFHQVYQVMERRGLRLAPDTKDPYVNELNGLCRTGTRERFLDRFLVASIIESRGAERFRLISEALEDAELKGFYRMLWASEAKHGNLFAQLALTYFDPDELYPRLETLLAQEAEILAGLPWRPSLH